MKLLAFQGPRAEPFQSGLICAIMIAPRGPDGLRPFSETGMSLDKFIKVRSAFHRCNEADQRKILDAVAGNNSSEENDTPEMAQTKAELREFVRQMLVKLES